MRVPAFRATLRRIGCGPLTVAPLCRFVVCLYCRKVHRGARKNGQGQRVGLAATAACSCNAICK